MSLLQNLTALGDELIAGELPVGHEANKVLGALIHYLETGSLAAPERAPSVAVQRELNEDKAEIERLRSQLAEAQAGQVPPAPAPPVAQQAPAVSQVPTPPPPVPPADQVTAPQPPAEQA